MSNIMNCHQQNDFRCAACPPSQKLPSFVTFREVSEHSLQVHRVSLETAVQSSTLLPDKLVMYLCKLCTPDHREVFLCETLVKNHLETHSAFFLRRWKEYSEIKCRICEEVIKEADLQEHVDKFHPVDMFADINDLENYKLKSSPKSPFTQDLDSSPKEEQSHSLPNTLIAVTKKMRSWECRQPAAEDSLLWDSCFQPEQLISKYFSKLAPAPQRQGEAGETVTLPTKPLISVKPLNLLQAQAKQATKSENQKTSESQVEQSPRKKPSRRSQNSCNIQNSPSRPINRSRRSLSQHKSRSRSPLPAAIKSSKGRELPPAKTLQSRRNFSHHVPTGTCLLCGMQVPKNRLAMHNTYNHQDLMFRCKVGTCRTSRRSCYLFANQLNSHHQDYHNLNRNCQLNTRESMTGLPACMVKISCSKCSYFVLYPDTKPVVKHLWSAHRIEDHPVSLLMYHCRVCERPFSSMEMVVEHSKDHLDGRSQSWADLNLYQGSARRRRSSGRNIFRSPSRKSRRSPGRKSRSPSRKSRSPRRKRKISPIRRYRSSPSWNSRRSPNTKSRRSPRRNSRRSSSLSSKSLSGESRRSPSRKSRRSPSMKSRRSPSRKSRRSPSRKSRRSRSRKSRRSPSRKSRMSPSRKSRRSPSRISRRSPSRKSRRSPSRKNRRSPNRKSSRSLSRRSRGSPGTSRSGSPPGNTSQFYKYRARGWNMSEGHYN